MAAPLRVPVPARAAAPMALRGLATTTAEALGLPKLGVSNGGGESSAAAR